MNIKTVCLNLDLRYDNWVKNIYPEWIKHNIYPEAFICGSAGYNLPYAHYDEKLLPILYKNSINYPTWHIRHNAYDAWKSHRKIIEYVYYQTNDILLLLEDDAFPENDFTKIYNECLPWLNENQVDMLYFGHYSNNHLTDIGHKYIYKTNGSGGWHGVIMNRHVMKAILALLPLGPYDWLCQQYIHQHYKCYAISPCIISQQSGFSYVEQNNLVKPDRNMK